MNDRVHPVITGLHPVGEPSSAEDFDPFAAGELARVVPTTEAQREVWLADQLGTEASLAYNESASLYLQGALDTPALERALLGLAARHEALRATIGPDGSELLISAEPRLPLERVDLRGIESAAAARQRDAVRLDAV